MDQKIKNYVGISIIAALALAAILGFWYDASYSKSVIPQRTFQVSGEGKIISMYEGSFFPEPVPFGIGSAGVAYGKGGDGPSVEPGSQEIRMNITLTYEIK